jgi:hypothetical protein
VSSAALEGPGTCSWVVREGCAAVSTSMCLHGVKSGLHLHFLSNPQFGEVYCAQRDESLLGGQQKAQLQQLAA